MRHLIDAHLDLAWSALYWNRDLSLSVDDVRNSERHMVDHPARGRNTVTFPEMQRANVRVCLGTVLARSKPEVCPAQGFSRRDLDFRTQLHACAVGRSHLEYYRELERQQLIQFIRTSTELKAHAKCWDNETPPPLGMILAMEGADPIMEPDQAQTWWDAGLRCVGLAHYGQGPYAAGTGMEGPITPAGRQLLKEFDRLGMIVDLTHTAEPGFFELLDNFGGAVLASHNMCREITPSDRQFSDEQLQSLIARDAVIGIALDAWMVRPGWTIGVSTRETVGMEDVADHVDHICQIAGSTQHVGIGSDLDGGFGTEQTPHDLNTIADLHKLEDILSRRGYSSNDLDGLCHGNWLRFFQSALPTN